MAESQGDDSIAPRRSLKPILPPPPPELVEEKRREEQARDQQAREKQAREKEARDKQAREKRAREQQAREQQAREKQAREKQSRAARTQETPREPQHQKAAPTTPTEPAPAASESRPKKERAPRREARRPEPRPQDRSGGPRRTRRAQLRLVQVDAWSVMKTSFLLSIALGIVLVVAVAVIWTVLGAAGVWDSINSIVQQAIGTEEGNTFDVEDYAGMSRVMGFAMIVAVVDVILITAIATLGAFLYNLAAALLGGIEVTLAEDS